MPAGKPKATIDQMRFARLLLAATFLLAPWSQADVRDCACDAARPETMERSECSLCAVAEAQPAEPPYFFVRDASPRKPNRWLALPRSHGRRPEELATMAPQDRAAYWTAAIGKARELWGDSWGLAVNSVERRTQCHMHIHIGKLAPGVEDEHFVAVDRPAEIPVPRQGDGVWVHPAGGKLHVHHGNDTPELLLER